MRESSFIDQNKKKWKTYEALIAREDQDPETLHQAFVEITDDLSYARTFYPNRSVRFYLNSIAQRLFYQLTRTRRFTLKDLIQFWTFQLPTLSYQYRKELRLSLLVFSFAFIVGVFSSYHDPNFVQTILGSEYVQMTEDNIAQGDPMAVYKSMNETDMFLGITLNNILVSIRTFLMGIFFAFGSLVILFYNGVMVGSFQYFFIEHSLFRESALTIWMHGTIEISCIIIAGGAGLIMGKHLLFPGTFTRFQSFKIGGIRGLQVLMGILPLVTLAAFIEGFFTRHTGTPDLIRLLFIGLCLAFVLWYFVWYPNYLNRSGRLAQLPTEITPLFAPNIELQQIKSTDRIIGDALLATRQTIGQSFKSQWAAWVTVGLAIGVMHHLNVFDPVDEPFFQLLGVITTPDLYSGWYVITTCGILWWLNLTIPLLQPFKTNQLKTGPLWLVSGIFILFWIGFSFAAKPLGIIMLLLMVTYYYFMLVVWSEESGTWMRIMIRTKNLLQNNLNRFVTVLVPLLLMELLVLFLSYFTIAKGIQMMISWNIGMNDATSKGLLAIYIAFLSSVFLTLHYQACRMMYWSFMELNEATGIKSDVRKLFTDA